MTNNNNVNKVKNVRTAYQFYLKSCKRLSEEPKNNFIKRCAAVWKKMVLKDKSIYIEMNSKDKIRFAEESESRKCKCKCHAVICDLCICVNGISLHSSVIQNQLPNHVDQLIVNKTNYISENILNNSNE